MKGNYLLFFCQKLFESCKASIWHRLCIGSQLLQKPLSSSVLISIQSAISGITVYRTDPEIICYDYIRYHNDSYGCSYSLSIVLSWAKGHMCNNITTSNALTFKGCGQYAIKHLAKYTASVHLHLRMKLLRVWDLMYCIPTFVSQKLDFNQELWVELTILSLAFFFTFFFNPAKKLPVLVPVLFGLLEKVTWNMSDGLFMNIKDFEKTFNNLHIWVCVGLTCCNCFYNISRHALHYLLDIKLLNMFM